MAHYISYFYTVMDDDIILVNGATGPYAFPPGKLLRIWRDDVSGAFISWDSVKIDKTTELTTPAFLFPKVTKVIEKQIPTFKDLPQKFYDNGNFESLLTPPAPPGELDLYTSMALAPLGNATSTLVSGKVTINFWKGIGAVVRANTHLNQIIMHLLEDEIRALMPDHQANYGNPGKVFTLPNKETPYAKLARDVRDLEESLRINQSRLEAMDKQEYVRNLDLVKLVGEYKETLALMMEDVGVRMDDDGRPSLIFKTKLVYAYLPWCDRTVNLGKFIVSLTRLNSEGRVNWDCAPPYRPLPSRDGDSFFQHPHVKNGRMCGGDDTFPSGLYLHDEIIHQLRLGNIITVAEHIVAFLASPNAANPYHGAEHWPDAPIEQLSLDLKEVIINGRNSYIDGEEETAQVRANSEDEEDERDRGDGISEEEREF